MTKRNYCLHFEIWLHAEVSLHFKKEKKKYDFCPQTVALANLHFIKRTIINYTRASRNCKVFVDIRSRWGRLKLSMFLIVNNILLIKFPTQSVCSFHSLKKGRVPFWSWRIIIWRERSYPDSVSFSRVSASISDEYPERSFA